MSSGIEGIVESSESTPSSIPVAVHEQTHVADLAKQPPESNVSQQPSEPAPTQQTTEQDVATSKSNEKNNLNGTENQDIKMMQSDISDVVQKTKLVTEGDNTKPSAAMVQGAEDNTMAVSHDVDLEKGKTEIIEPKADTAENTATLPDTAVAVEQKKVEQSSEEVEQQPQDGEDETSSRHGEEEQAEEEEATVISRNISAPSLAANDNAMDVMDSGGSIGGSEKSAPALTRRSLRARAPKSNSASNASINGGASTGNGILDDSSMKGSSAALEFNGNTSDSNGSITFTAAYAIDETSNMSTSSRSSRKRRGSTCDMAEELQHHINDSLSVHKLCEYQWPQDKTGDWYLLQEQISEYLEIKSFKRKYPELSRRAVEMNERIYLREQNVVTEQQCDLGLTALKTDEVCDMMMRDYPKKYDEFCKLMHEREKERIAEKQKQRYDQPAVDKNDKSKMAYFRKRALKSASEFNAHFMRELRDERRSYFDLQTFEVHYPKARRKVLPPEATKPSSYPVALLPGQYQAYYKQYHPEQLKFLPLNSVLTALVPLPPSSQLPLKSIDNESDDAQSQSSQCMSVHECDLCTYKTNKKYNLDRHKRTHQGASGGGSAGSSSSGSSSSSSGSSSSGDSSSGSSSSGSDSEDEDAPLVAAADKDVADGATITTTVVTPTSSRGSKAGRGGARGRGARPRTPASTPTPAKKRKLSSTPKSTPTHSARTSPCPEVTPRPDASCSICGTDTKEALIRCGECQKHGHPTCLEITAEMLPIIKTYSWQCMECKTCIECMDPHDEDKMMFCDHCDRGYHTFCVGVSTIPTGRWECKSCKAGGDVPGGTTGAGASPKGGDKKEETPANTLKRTPVSQSARRRGRPLVR